MHFLFLHRCPGVPDVECCALCIQGWGRTGGVHQCFVIIQELVFGIKKISNVHFCLNIIVRVHVFFCAIGDLKFNCHGSFLGEHNGVQKTYMHIHNLCSCACSAYTHSYFHMKMYMHTCLRTYAYAYAYPCTHTCTYKIYMCI